MSKATAQSASGTLVRLATVFLFTVGMTACNRNTDKPMPPQAPQRPQTMKLKEGPALLPAVLLYAAPATARHASSPVADRAIKRT